MRVLHAFALRQVLADVLPELRLPRHVRVLVLPLRHSRGDGLSLRGAFCGDRPERRRTLIAPIQTLYTLISAAMNSGAVHSLAESAAFQSVLKTDSRTQRLVAGDLRDTLRGRVVRLPDPEGPGFFVFS